MEARRIIAADYVLTVIAGWVDAQGFLALQGRYVSFMSGNTTLFGLDLGMAHWSDARPLAGLIGLFLSGGFLGAVLSSLGGRRSISVVLGTEGTVLLLALALADSPGMAGISPSLLAFAMGIQNAATGAIGPVTVGLTYVTGTLVKAGQELGKMILGSGSVSVFANSMLSWIALLFGVVAGAAAHARFGLTALSVPSLVVFGLAALFASLTLRNGTSGAGMDVQ